MASESVLFLGGPASGRFMGVKSDMRTVAVAVEPHVVIGGPVEPADLVTFETVHYYRKHLRGESRTFSIFTPGDWDGDRVLAELIDKAGRAHTGRQGRVKQ